MPAARGRARRSPAPASACARGYSPPTMSMLREGLCVGLLLGPLGCLQPPPAAQGESVAPDGDADDAVLLAARPPGRLYASGEVRGFELRQGGQRIGSSWGRYVGVDEAGHHRFETRIELTFPGRAPARSSGELVLDAEGQLVAGFERSNAAELRFHRDGDAIVFTAGTQTDEIGYEPQRQPTAFMAHSAIFHAELMFGLHGIVGREPAWRLVSLSGGAPVEWSARVLDRSPGNHQLRLQTSLGELITLVDGRVASIEVAATELAIVAMATPAWPSFTIEGPRVLAWTKPADATFDVRELELPGPPDAPALAGELLVPTGAAGPVPGVLFVSGTGLEDRYGFAGPPPVDLGSHELTDALAQSGFAVLRFDERGRGRSAPGPLGFLAQVDDAARALATLAVQPEVDPDRIVVVAHGEGGLRALMLASKRAGDIHALALLAVPGRPYEQVMRAQAEARIEALPPEIRDRARAQQRAMLDDLVSGRAVPEELAPQAQWLREVFAVKPAELVGRVRVPMLLAQGDKDFEIDPVADVRALERGAKSRGANFEVRRYPGLDHLFKPEAGTSSPERYLVDRRVDSQFITDVIAWARRVTSASTKPRRPRG